MSAYVQRWHVVPQVQIDVVLLAALESVVSVNAGTGDNQELILEDADWVSMAPILELVAGDAIKNLFSIVHDLETLFEGNWDFSDVASTNKEEPVWFSLNILEVVLKLIWDVNTTLWNRIRKHVVSVNHFRVTLKDINPFKGFGWILGFGRHHLF